MENKTQPAPNEFKTLNGGAEIRVKLIYGDQENVLCRKLALREMSKLGAVWAQEVGELKLYVKRAAGETDDDWLDTLTDESWKTLIEEGRRVNFPRFSAFFERQKTAIDAIGSEFVTQAIKATMGS